jgi:hypothetical protein
VKSLILSGGLYITFQFILSTLTWGASSPQGPLLAHNYHPLQGLFLNLEAEKAEGLPKGQWKVSIGFVESNTININSNPTLFIVLDQEISRLDIAASYGITDTLEVGLEIPFLWRHGGVLDPLIKTVEDFLGVTFRGRNQRPQNILEFSIFRTTDQIFLEFTEDASSVGDITLKGKYLLVKEKPGQVSIAARAALRFPTGDEALVLGSGHPDFGIGALFQKSIRNFTLYGDVDLILPGDTFEPFDWELRPIVGFGFAGEFRWTPDFSVLLQLDFHSAAFQDTEATSLDNGNVFELTFGFSSRIRENLIWKVGGVENLNRPQSSADFSILSQLSFEF